MNLEAEIRRLSRSSYWQMLYQNASLSGQSMFINQNNLSGLQVYFLHWLKIYKMLYEDLSKEEYVNLTEEVINDDDRCDAFLHWKGRKISKQIKAMKQQEKIQNSKLKSSDNAFAFDVDFRG